MIREHAKKTKFSGTKILKLEKLSYELEQNTFCHIFFIFPTALPLVLQIWFAACDAHNFIVGKLLTWPCITTTTIASSTDQAPLGRLCVVILYLDGYLKYRNIKPSQHQACIVGLKEN